MSVIDLNQGGLCSVKSHLLKRRLADREREMRMRTSALGGEKPFSQKGISESSFHLARLNLADF